MSILVISLFIHVTKMVLRGHASFVLSFMAMDKTSQNNLVDIINHVYHYHTIPSQHYNCHMYYLSILIVISFGFFFLASFYFLFINHCEFGLGFFQLFFFLYFYLNPTVPNYNYIFIKF